MQSDTGRLRSPDPVEVEPQKATAPLIEEFLVLDPAGVPSHRIAYAESVEDPKAVGRDEETGAARSHAGLFSTISALMPRCARARKRASCDNRRRRSGYGISSSQHPALRPLKYSPHTNWVPDEYRFSDHWNRYVSIAQRVTWFACCA